MLNTKNSQPMLVSTKNNMIRFYKYLAIALVALFSNVALGQNTITLTNPTKVSCLGGTDGTINVSVSGFTPTSYIIFSSTFPSTTISPITNPMDINGLPIGLYTVEATDGSNTVTNTVTVDQIATLQIVGYKIH